LSTLNYLKGQLLYKTRFRAHGSGATHAQYSVEASVAYVQGVVADYLRYGGVDESFIGGKRFLEVGPGDNLGVAITLLAKGAEQVTCFDRFRPLADDRRNTVIYRRLYESFAEDERRRLDDILKFHSNGEVEFDTAHLHCRYGLAIEAWNPVAEFDVVLSRAVLEHVFDLDRAWHAMAKALKPDGQMWHKVDLRHHGFFGQFHPLYFLTVNDRLWRLISSPDPTLNRRRRSDFRRLADETFEDCDLFITHILDNPELTPHRCAILESIDYTAQDLRAVEDIRSRLIGPLRDAPTTELLVTGIFVIARCPRGLASSAGMSRPFIDGANASANKPSLSGVSR
jgi:SAM-dependent methyltransferase